MRVYQARELHCLNARLVLTVKIGTEEEVLKQAVDQRCCIVDWQISRSSMMSKDAWCGRNCLLNSCYECQIACGALAASRLRLDLLLESHTTSLLSGLSTISVEHSGLGSSSSSICRSSGGAGLPSSKNSDGNRHFLGVSSTALLCGTSIPSMLYSLLSSYSWSCQSNGCTVPSVTTSSGDNRHLIWVISTAFLARNARTCFLRE